MGQEELEAAWCPLQGTGRTTLPGRSLLKATNHTNMEANPKIDLYDYLDVCMPHLRFYLIRLRHLYDYAPKLGRRE